MPRAGKIWKTAYPKHSQAHVSTNQPVLGRGLIRYLGKTLSGAPKSDVGSPKVHAYDMRKINICSLIMCLGWLESSRSPWAIVKRYGRRCFDFVLSKMAKGSAVSVVRSGVPPQIVAAVSLPFPAGSGQTFTRIG